MSHPIGFNPLRWDCEKLGCFNKKRRPKIEVFAGCFPGRINFGDIDGIVEISGNALILEWKSQNRDLPLGQRIMYRNMTSGGPITVMVIIGDPETMEITHYCVFWGGRQSPANGYRAISLEEIKEKMARWAQWALENPFGRGVAV